MSYWHNLKHENGASGTSLPRGFKPASMSAAIVGCPNTIPTTRCFGLGQESVIVSLRQDSAARTDRSQLNM